MLKLRASGVWAVIMLLAGLCLCHAALASYAVPNEDMGTGIIQSVDYANHTVTVNGQRYKISSKASYVNGVARNIGGLQPGMNIRFIANSPVKNPGSVITNIIVLPPPSR
ncbi:MAG: hypothetical protein WBR15_00630 [Gammaproteobacteria bacterium]